MNIKEALEEFNFFNEGDYITKNMSIAKDVVLTAYEKEKETSQYIQSQLDIANAKLVEEKEKNKELEKIAMLELNRFIYGKHLSEGDIKDNLSILFEIIRKQSKEIEELKEGFKIQEHNYQVAIEEMEQRWKDKIKAKIEELERQEKEEPDAFLCKKVLQSLLEKE